MGTWARVAAAWTGSQLTVYYDGTQVVTFSSSSHGLTVGRSSADILLMTDNTASETGDGRLAAFAIKNSALTASQVAALGAPDTTGIFADGTANVVEFRLDGSACMTA